MKYKRGHGLRPDDFYLAATCGPQNLHPWIGLYFEPEYFENHNQFLV